MNFNQFKVITFDCFGTLIDWENGILNALRPVVIRSGVSVSDEELLSIYGEVESRLELGQYRSYWDILTAVADAIFDRLSIETTNSDTACLVNSVANWPPFPDTVEALQRLQSRYKLAVISNIDDDLFAHTAKQLGIDFDWVITAAQVGAYKPSLKVFEHALRTIGLPRNQILHVAQSLYHDIAPANIIGLQSVWVNRRMDQSGGGATPEATAQSDFEVPDLKSLADRMGL